MFKKLLTIAAVGALCFSAQAARVLDHFIDYSTWTEWNLYEMGYKAYIEDGCLTSTNPMKEDEETGEMVPDWYQYFMAPKWDAEPGQTYYVTFKVKGSAEGSANIDFRWSWGDDPVSQTLTWGTDWEEVELCAAEVGGGCDMIFQTTFAGKFQCAWIKVEHEENASQRPEEWVDCLINGDAEGEYGEYPCAYTKEYGVNNNEPYPSNIETVDGSKVFAVHAKAVNPDDWRDDEGGVKPDVAWQNQFWIQSPKEWHTGDIFRVSFDYKASKAVNTNTQAHKEVPGNYLHWSLLGDVAFTTDWQHFEKKVTVSSEQNGMWSAAFNLGAQVYAEDLDFYYDNLKWESLKLDEGWFVAGDFNDNNLGEAVEFAWNDDDEVYEVCIGQDKPASRIKISTRRGQDAAFNSNLIKVKNPEEIIYEYDEEEPNWIDFEMGGSKWIDLPEAGVWSIIIDVDYGQILFAGGNILGIEGICVDDNAAAVYYNLQGVRVDNPSHGIFIVKKGSKVSKQVIR